MARPPESELGSSARARQRVPSWAYLSIPLGYLAVLTVLMLVVHEWIARLLFTTWSLSTVQIYGAAMAAMALAVIAWFTALRGTPAPGGRARLWVAAVCSVPAALLVELPARSWGRLHAERHIRDLGYELGTTENTIGATVVFAAIPTVALGLVLTWWVYRHPRRVAFAYAALTAWIAAVAAAGWALGHP